MLRRIKDILTMRIGPGADPERIAERRQLAAAALLIAVARADYVLDPREEAAMHAALARTFALSQQDIDELMALAEQEQNEASSDHPFTRLINEEFSDAAKSELIADMWRVAHADGNLHKYEEHLIRKIAVLIYVPHSEFIRTKLQAAAALAPGAA